MNVAVINNSQQRESLREKAMINSHLRSLSEMLVTAKNKKTNDQQKPVFQSFADDVETRSTDSDNHGASDIDSRD